MKNTRLILFTSALILSFLAVQGTQIWASPTVNAITTNTGTGNQVMSTVSTSHMTVQLLYSAFADPGQIEQISAITIATSSVTIISFSIDIFSHVGNQFVKLASHTIVANTNVESGDEWQTSLVVTIPTNAQRGPLNGTVTEVSQQTSYYYSSYYGAPCYCTPYNTRNYNTPQYVRYPNAVMGTQVSPQGHTQPYMHQPAYAYEPNTPQDVRYPNGVIALQTPSQNHVQRYVYQPVNVYQYQPSYVSQPVPYYVLNYGQNYSPLVISSEQTFTLTYVLATSPGY